MTILGHFKEPGPAFSYCEELYGQYRPYRPYLVLKDVEYI